MALGEMADTVYAFERKNLYRGRCCIGGCVHVIYYHCYYYFGPARSCDNKIPLNKFL